MIVQHHLNRNSRKQISVTPFVDERVHESSILEFGKYFRSNAAADIEAAHRFCAQRQIAGLSTVNRNKKIQRLDANFGFVGQSSLGNNHAGIIFGGKAVRKPLGLFQAAVVLEEPVDVKEPGTG